MKILVLNSGSSSQKSALYELGDALATDPPPPLWEAKIEWGTQVGDIQVRGDGASVEGSVRTGDRQSAMTRMLDSLWSGKTRVLSKPSEIDAVGHRVVHGGPRLYEPTVVTTDVKAILASVAAIAPLHNRAELEGMEIVESVLGSVCQVAVFDTGFHHNLPLPAVVYPGPYTWFQAGIRRYGFHGINHQYCAERAAQLLQRALPSLKLITCHLGNGCSLAAIRGGQSVDTTMGFTPLEGLMMGTRSGSVDPGILTYLMRQTGIRSQELDDVLNEQSGLLGISGFGDMREVLAAMKQGKERAKLAFDMYVHRLQAAIGAMAAVAGGMDALVFTAGVGEHSPEVRAATCEKLGFLGIQLDAGKNSHSPADAEISVSNSKAKVLIIRAQEDWAIAKACWKIVMRNRTTKTTK